MESCWLENIPKVSKNKVCYFAVSLVNSYNREKSRKRTTKLPLCLWFFKFFLVIYRKMKSKYAQVDGH